MPRKDWLKTRVICWLTALLHFNKLLQIPLLTLHKICDIPFYEMIEAFTKVKPNSFPILSNIYQFFLNEANSIQNGGPEYCRSNGFLNIWWPADELQMIKLFYEKNIDQFYLESESLLKQLIIENSIDLDENMVHELFSLNKEVMKKPFENINKKLTLNYNIFEAYRSYLNGSDIPLEEKISCYVIERESYKWDTWDSWCKEVVWYGNKQGAYMYEVKNIIDTINYSNVDSLGKGHSIEGHY
jgi:hypothetical protein